MPKSEYVDYCNERFYIQSSKRYFQSGRKNVAERLLHRRIWSDANGPIPDGMVVHHKDGDWKNNNINNLELLPNVEHCKVHMSIRWKNHDQASVFIEGLEKARDEAKEWHRSAEGREWHIENGKLSWQSKKTTLVSCVVCSSNFETYFPQKAKTCCKSCRQKLNYKNRFVIKSTCQECGSEFMGSKYKAISFCSRGCSNRHRVSEAA